MRVSTSDKGSWGSGFSSLMVLGDLVAQNGAEGLNDKIVMFA